MLSSLAGISWGKLFVYDGEGTEELRVVLPKVEDVPLRTVIATLSQLNLDLEDLSSLRFDKADDVSEVLRLPQTFFDEYLNAPQLIQIILNDKLRDIISVHYKRRLRKHFSDRDTMKAKVKTLHSKINLLDLQSLGPYHDEVVRRIPTNLYRHLSPYVALTSRTFKNTSEGFKRLFGLTVSKIKSLAYAIRARVNQAFDFLERVRQDERVIRTIQILTPLVKRAASFALMMAKLAILTAQICALAGVFVLKSGLTARKAKALQAGIQEKLALRPEESASLEAGQETWNQLYLPLLQNRGQRPRFFGLAMPEDPEETETREEE